MQSWQPICISKSTLGLLRNQRRERLRRIRTRIYFSLGFISLQSTSSTSMKILTFKGITKMKNISRSMKQRPWRRVMAITQMGREARTKTRRSCLKIWKTFITSESRYTLKQKQSMQSASCPNRSSKPCTRLFPSLPSWAMAPLPSLIPSLRRL